MSRFQYQGLAEPIQFSSPAETVTMDKWYRQHPTAPRQRTSPLNSGSFLHDPTDFGETVLVDKWYQRTSEPVLPRRGAAEGGVWGPLEPSLRLTPNMDTWWQPPPGPMRATPRPASSEQFFTIVAEAPVPDLPTWWQPASEPVKVVQLWPLGGETKPLEPSLFIEPTIDTWYVQASIPVRTHQPRPLTTGLLGLDTTILVAVTGALTVDAYEVVSSICFEQEIVSSIVFEEEVQGTIVHEQEVRS